MNDLLVAFLSGAILVPVAILGIGAQARRRRARRTRPRDWARYDVPTVIRRRRGRNV